jgi:RNA polymerase sigma-70 factor, ECF subfamily
MSAFSAAINIEPETRSEIQPRAGASDDKLVTFVQAAEQSRAQLLWLARRILPEREEAEDVVQEALLKAFRSLAQFRGDAQMSRWLRVIVENTARDWLRNRKGRVLLPLEVEQPEEGGTTTLDLPHPAENPEERCERKELERILRHEIGQMNSISRSAIQLCVLEELSHRAAARTLNISVVKVKSRVFSGKQLLKRVLCRRVGAQRGRVESPSDCPAKSAG